MERNDYQLIGVAREKAPMELASSFLQAAIIVFLGYFLMGWLIKLANPLLAFFMTILAANVYSCIRTFLRIRSEILTSGLSKLDRGQLDKDEMRIVIARYFCVHNALLRSGILSALLGLLGATFLVNETLFHLQGSELLKLFMLVSIFGTLSLAVTNIFTVIIAEWKYLRAESIFEFFGELDRRTTRIEDARITRIN